MGIRGQTLPADFLAEVHQLLFAETALEESAGVDSGRAMALEVDQVAAMCFVAGMPEMHESGVVECRRRLEARDVAAKLGGLLVRLDDDGGGVPANIASNALLQLSAAGMGRLRFGRNGVD